MCRKPWSSQTLVAELNDLSGLRALLDAEGEHIAAVIIEPVVGNMGVIPPEPGFLEALREATRAVGALLIFDEVITGFRLAYGGVQTQLGIDPDLTVLGKIVGGGLPLAAFGGKRAIMEQLAPLGPVYQAGTLSGNPLAVAAGLQTLELLAKPGTYERLEELRRAARSRSARRAGDDCRHPRASIASARCGRCSSAPRWCATRPTARACVTELYARWFRGMLERGIYLPPSQFEAAFISLAHGEADIETTVRAAREVVATLR